MIVDSFMHTARWAFCVARGPADSGRDRRAWRCRDLSNRAPESRAPFHRIVSDDQNIWRKRTCSMSVIFSFSKFSTTSFDWPIDCNHWATLISANNRRERFIMSCATLFKKHTQFTSNRIRKLRAMMLHQRLRSDRRRLRSLCRAVWCRNSWMLFHKQTNKQRWRWFLVTRST